MSNQDIKLLVAEARPEYRHIWLRLSRGLPIEVVDTDIRGLLAMNVDSVVMPGWIAHERLGGHPELGRAQVISNSNGLVGTARWVVTTPSFTSSKEDEKTTGVPQWPAEPILQGRWTFGRIFSSIAQHNASLPGSRISTIAFEPEFLNFSSKYDEEVEGVLEALREAVALLSS